MATAITPLANITLSSTATTVTFSSISGAYRDLYLVAQIAGGTGGNAFYCKINNDATSGNYSYVYMLGNGSSTSSISGNDYRFGYDGAVNVLHFFDYSLTNRHKAVLCRANDANSRVDGRIVRWASTSAITSLVLSTSGASFASGSTFALYGVSA